MQNRANRPAAFCILHSAFGARRRAVRWAFHHFYREFAWTYDVVAWLVSDGLWRRWALAALPELQGRILELGFGPGHMQLALSGRHTVAGLDASPQMAAMAAQRLRRYGASPRLALGLAQALPFPGAAFDTVLATFPADYILDPDTHAEILRVLAPGGRLVIIPTARLDASLYARAVNLAYRLTLQAPPHGGAPPPAAEWLKVEGMEFRQHWAAVGPSQVLVVVGSKAGYGSDS
jgi:ubiquinone/menaquinone biosynthesis C-methylase UbiE